MSLTHSLQNIKCPTLVDFKSIDVSYLNIFEELDLSYCTLETIPNVSSRIDATVIEVNSSNELQ